MREIKFRFYSILSREYLHDFSADRDGITLTGEHACNGWLAYDFKVEKYLCEDEVILEQFTGLHDKNGKEIYEGDILSYYSALIPKGSNPVVKQVVRWKVYQYVGINNWGAAEIIGNSHENPELLEATK